MCALSDHILPASPARCTAILLTLGCIFSLPRQLGAQTRVSSAGVPSYDVVSIKPNNSGSSKTNVSISDGDYDATNMSIKTLILQAYSLKESQLSDLPKWADSYRFDLQAKLLAPDAGVMDALTDAQRRSMLQPILVDRFQLKFHREWEVKPVFELVVAKGGTKLHAIPGTETASADGGEKAKTGRFSVRDGSLTATHVPISTLVDYLPDQVQRVVIDKTGLTGGYNLQLKWMPDDVPASSNADAPPDLFTALREQLGLKLKPSRASIEIFVVDHVEPPSEN